MKAPGRLTEWLFPLLFLSNNWISRMGVILVSAAGVFWLFLTPMMINDRIRNDYLGLLTILLLPAAFLVGLALIPAGIFLRRRGADSVPWSVRTPEERSVALRRLITFIAGATVVNGVIASQLSYTAVRHMESVEFCGQTCHTVMRPEFVSHQNSAHARVECVQCHVGSGAGWYVRSKVNGARQGVEVATGSYPRPIPTPLRFSRPTTETCEFCHSRSRPGDDRVRMFPKFAEDEANSPAITVLLMRTGAIHRAHWSRRIRYASDNSRANIIWVESYGGSGKAVRYAASAQSGAAGQSYEREMDCSDCHNRPAHAFQTPQQALDQALQDGAISRALPFARKKGIEILTAVYQGEADAADRIPKAFEGFYRTERPAVFRQRAEEVSAAGRALLNLYRRNVFPDMRVSWGTYPDHLGHSDSPGCFRCHDDQHVTASGDKITQDCGACHNLLAVEDPAPKILSDLGWAAAIP